MRVLSRVRERRYAGRVLPPVWARGGIRGALRRGSGWGRFGRGAGPPVWSRNRSVRCPPISSASPPCRGDRLDQSRGRIGLAPGRGADQRRTMKRLMLALSVLFALPSAATAGVRVPSLDWAPCRGQERFDCATARVPLDYRNPGGSRIRLAVIRHRATRPSRRIGTAFFSPGGPAAAKRLFPTVIAGLLAPLRERFDVISWDPRGLGESTAVKCFASQAAEDRFFAGLGTPAYTFPVGPLETSGWIQRSRAFGRRCKRRSGELMRHITTARRSRSMSLADSAVVMCRMSSPLRRLQRRPKALER